MAAGQVGELQSMSRALLNNRDVQHELMTSYSVDECWMFDQQAIDYLQIDMERCRADIMVCELMTVARGRSAPATIARPNMGIMSQSQIRARTFSAGVWCGAWGWAINVVSPAGGLA